MPNLKEVYNEGITFVKMVDGELRGCIFINSNGLYIPLELDSNSLNFIKYYPNIMTKLINGEIIYLPYHTMYIGYIKNEGPYGENECFISEYNSKSYELSELLVNIDKNIFEDNKDTKKLLKVGNFYTEK